MAQPKRLVCFVEGKGDLAAVPVLARRVLKRNGATDVLVVDDGKPYEVHGIGKLLKKEKGKPRSNWLRYLESTGRERPNVGAVLLVLDGDVDRVSRDWPSYADRYKTDAFCARDVARVLADDSRAARGGEAFSVAVVFAMKEFETWLLAGVESLRGKPLAEGRGKVPSDATCPALGEIEAKRDAKGELKKIIPGYEQSLDQGVLARELELDLVSTQCRSFRRFCSALQQLVEAVRGGRAVVTPSLPSS